jgi:hypothetical protein
MLWASFLFTLYLLLLLFFLNKNRFVKSSGLTPQLITLLFMLKVIMGVFFTWYNITYNGDLVNTYHNSLEETMLLKKNPLAFFTSLFKSGYGDYEGFYSSHSYWNDLRFIFLDKLVALLNLLSFKNIYINTLIFNAVIFLGHIMLYRTFCSLWPQKKGAVLAGCFLIPSSLFFLSGINKDSLIFLGITMVITGMHLIPVIKKTYLHIKPLLLFSGGLLIMFIFRNFFFAAAIPAIAAYYINNSLKTKPWMVFLSVFVLLLVFILSNSSVMAIICQRQNDFLHLSYASSNIPVAVLHPTIKSFGSHLPMALDIIFLRPYAWHSYNIYYFFCGVEILIITLLLLTSLYFVIKNKIPVFNQPLVLFCIMFSFTALLIIGYTIPILGAVVRYRSAFFPLLITPFLCSFSLTKFNLYFNRATTAPAE